MAWPWPPVFLWGDSPGAYYNTATMEKYWRSLTDAIVDPTGYDGDGAIGFDAGSGITSGPQVISGNPNIATIFPADHGRFPSDNKRVIVGSRVYIGAYPGSTQALLYVLNAAGLVQLTVAIEPAGTLSVYQGNLDTLIADWSSYGPLTLDWHRLSIQSYIARTLGCMDLSVDSTTVYVDYIDTAIEDDEEWAGVGFGGTEDIKHSHPWLFSGYASIADRRLIHGYLRAAYLPVDANGQYTDWTPNAGTIATAIDDTVPDDATTQIEPDGANSEFSVTVDDLPVTRKVYGAQLAIRYKRNVFGAASLRPHVVMNSSPYHIDALGGAADDWAVARAVWDKNPATNTPWSRTAINNAEWGGRSQA